MDGKRNSNGGAGAGRAADVKFAVHLSDALANSGNSDAQWHARGSFWNHVENPNSVILDFDADRVGIAFEAYRRRAGSGVTVHVVQRFLHDPKDGELHGLFETAKIRRNLQVDLSSASLREEFGVGIERDHESGLFQQGRVQEG